MIDAMNKSYDVLYVLWM